MKPRTNMTLQEKMASDRESETQQFEDGERASDSESVNQQLEDVEGPRFRPLCCRGVVVNDGRQQAEHHVLNPVEDGSFYGMWRTMRLGKQRGSKKKGSHYIRRVATAIPRLTMSTLPGLTSLAAMGTTLFCVGGDSPDLFLFYYGDYEGLWRKGPPMLERRVSPRVVAVGGKLFVFGGCSETPHRASWAEVYDTSTNKWTHLPPLPPRLTPPTGPGRKRFFAAAIAVGREYESEQIVVGGWGQVFCTFDLSTQTWSCPDFDPGLMRYFTPDSVAVGSTLYCFSRVESCLLAYDCDSQAMFGGALRGRIAQHYLDTWTSPLYDGLLVLPHGGDGGGDDGSVRLVFVWCRDDGHFYLATRTSLHYATVRVAKIKVPGSREIQYLDASIVSASSLPIMHRFQLQDALFMDVVEGLQELSP